MRIRSVLLALGVGLLLTVNVAAAAAPPSGAGKFVQDLANNVLTIFNDPQLSVAEKERRMYEIAVKDFDVPRSARFTLGRFWKDASRSQRDEFTKVFEHYVAHIYAGQFNLFHDVDFDVRSASPQNQGIWLVRSKAMRHDGRPPLTIDWHVARVGNTYKVIDVSVDGVSQLLALRAQFVEVIEHNDNHVEALIDTLRQKVAE